VAALLAGSDIAALQVAANIVALLSLISLVAIAWRLWGGGAAIVAAIVYALHDAALDRMDANYVTWAQLPHDPGDGRGARGDAGADEAAIAGAGGRSRGRCAPRRRCASSPRG
jgi:hypothetical protein